MNQAKHSLVFALVFFLGVLTAHADPMGFTGQDVGSVGVAGSYSESSGVYTINASGADIWGTVDSFFYSQEQLGGDMEIVARVSSIENTNDWAKCGLMIRESLDANSRHAFIAITPAKGICFLRRLSSGDISYNTRDELQSAPIWLKLVRSSDLFTGYYSSDGTNWVEVGSATISMGDAVYIGLAVSSHENNVVNTAVMDNVSISFSEATPKVTITATDLIAQEEGLDTASFTVSRTADITDPLTVHYSRSGTAVNGVDYEALSGSVTVPAGQLSTQIIITPQSNPETEIAEDVTLTITEDAAYIIGTENSANIIIVDKLEENEALQLSQYGITWTFSTPARVGKFINGDWWVAGPVTIVSVTPTPAEGRHGSVLNPVAGRATGFDSRFAYDYDETLRAQFPLQMQAGDSLVSTISALPVGIRTTDTLASNYCIGYLLTAAVLTCIDSARDDTELSNSFRPPYCGDQKPLYGFNDIHDGTHNINGIRRNLLPNLPRPASIPDLSEYERLFERPWLDIRYGWAGRHLHPYENMPDYGREISNFSKTAALMLLLDDPERQFDTLMIRYIQFGIDLWGISNSNHHIWLAEGGHGIGRKWPILFAGLMLDDESMKTVNTTTTFAEDDHTYYGTGYRGQTVLYRIQVPMPHQEIDPSEWNNPPFDGWKCENYRIIGSHTLPGFAIAAQVMGAKDIWNHDVFFDYIDLWVAEKDYGSVDQNTLQPKAYGAFFRTFESTMWDMYHDYQPGAEDTVVPTLSNVACQPAQVTVGVTNSIILSALAQDSGLGSPGVAGVEYFIGTDPGAGNATALVATDGAFDSTSENVSATINTSQWQTGSSPYTIYIRAKDISNNWSAVSSLQIMVVGDDTEAPQASITSPSNNSVATTGTITVQGTAADASQITSITANGIAAQTTNGYATWSATINLSAGSNQIVVATQDEHSNVNSSATTIAVILDNLPPSVALTSPVAGQVFTTGTAAIQGTATDTTAVSSITVNGATAQTSNNYANWSAVVNLNEGANQITVAAADAYGNSNAAAAAVNITRDSIAPTVIVTAPNSGVVKTTSSLVITGVASDADTIEWVKVNGETADTINAFANWTKTITLAEGANQIVISSRDEPGNENAGAATVNVNLDSEGPEISITSPTDNQTLNSGQNVTVFGTAVDAHAIISLTVNGVAATSANGYADWTATLANLNEGQNQISVVGKDEYNNQSDPVTISVTIDSSAPTAAVTSHSNDDVTTANTINLAGTATDDGTIAWVKVNGVTAQTTNDFATWTTPLTLTEGANQITVSCQDEQGHTNNQAASLNIICDTHGPTATITTPEQDATVGTNQVSVTGTASDASSITWVKVNGTEVDSSNNFATWAVTINLSDGANQDIVVSAADTHGNTTPSAAQITITVNTSLDSDGDGIPDSWELLYGLNPNDPTDANQDLDGDGISNLMEFQSGTPPNDPDNTGPTASSLAAVPNSIRAKIDKSLILTADVSDLITGGSLIANAEYFIDSDPGVGNGQAMVSTDGAFNSSSETVSAAVDTKTWRKENTTHTLFVRGRDLGGNWGQAAQIQVDVVDGLPPGKIKSLRIVDKDKSPEPFMSTVEMVSSEDADKPASAVIDLQDSTWWSTLADSGDRQYLILDLGQDELIGRITIRPRADNYDLFPKTFKVKVATQEDFDGATDKVNDLIWHTVVTEAGFTAENSEPLSWDITERTGRYLLLDISEMNIDAQTGKARAEVAEVSAENVDDTTTTLITAWTASGDDGEEGTAFEYDIRFSLSALTESNFESADRLEGGPAPEAPGTEQTYLVQNLNPGTIYNIGIRALDEVQNLSELSVITGTTAALSHSGIDIISPVDESALKLEEGAPTYQWQSAVYSRFYIQFGADPSFPSGSLRYSNLKSTSFQPNTGQWRRIRQLTVKSGGTLYWRINGSAGRKSGFSATFHQFDLDGGTISPEGIPDGGAIAPNNIPTFSWTNTDAAIMQFQVEISPTEEFQTRGPAKALRLPARPTTNNSYTPSSREWSPKVLRLTQKSTGSLYWRIKGYDSDKTFVVVSAARSFSFDLGAFSGETPTGDLSVLVKPEFRWDYEGSAMTMFCVQLSTSPEFPRSPRETITLPSRWTSSESYELSRSEWYRYLGIASTALSGSGELYWRVKGRDDKRILMLVGATQTINLQTETLTAVVPEVSEYSSATPPTFNWAMSAGGDALFGLQFCKSSDFARTSRPYSVQPLRLTGTTYTLTDMKWSQVQRVAVDENDRGYWRVTGSDPSRRYFKFESQPVEFTVTAE